MSELKFTLPRFDGKADSDYLLWQLRLQAIPESKNLWHVIESTTSDVNLTTTSVNTQTGTDVMQVGTQADTQTGGPTTATGAEPVSAKPSSVSTAEQKRKAAAVIINGFGDKPLQVVASDTKEPKTIVQKLRERYPSTKLSTRM
jgi:hypothetical protein